MKPVLLFAVLVLAAGAACREGQDSEPVKAPSESTAPAGGGETAIVPGTKTEAPSAGPTGGSTTETITPPPAEGGSTGTPPPPPPSGTGGETSFLLKHPCADASLTWKCYPSRTLPNPTPDPDPVPTAEIKSGGALDAVNPKTANPVSR